MVLEEMGGDCNSREALLQIWGLAVTDDNRRANYMSETSCYLIATLYSKLSHLHASSFHFGLYTRSTAFDWSEFGLTPCECPHASADGRGSSW